MRHVLRPFTILAAIVLTVLAIQPAAHAAPRAPQSGGGEVFTVWDGSSYEYYKTCSATAPFTCGTFAQTMYLQITDSSARSVPITLGYHIEDITATAGQDYTFPVNGTVTIPANQYGTALFIPLVVDGITEPAETFRVHLTSSSVGGDISDTGIGTIYNDGLIPADCSLSRSSLYTVSMTCTNRPPTQQWRNSAQCGEEYPHVAFVNGPIVTGNGTSTTTCTSYVWTNASFSVVQ
jgi:Calx-beta domain